MVEGFFKILILVTVGTALPLAAQATLCSRVLSDTQSGNYYATDTATKPAVEASLVPAAELAAHAHLYFQNLFSKRHKSLTNRGYLSSDLPETALTSEIAEQYGIMFYTLYIYVFKTREEIAQHAEQNYRLSEGRGRKDPIYQGLYFLADVESEDYQKKSPKEKLESLIAGGATFYPDPNDTSVVEEYSPAQLATLLTASDKNIKLESDERAGPRLTVTGWFLPKIRGVVIANDLLESNLNKDLYKSIIWPYVNSGKLKITINQRVKESLEAVKNQVRKHQSAESNRYYDKNDPNGQSSTYKAILDRIQNGTAFTLEVIGPNDELVAGMIVTYFQNILLPETNHYVESIELDRMTQPSKNVVASPTITIKGIDLAKVATIALSELAKSSGISFLDSQIVSDFTAGIKGRYITADQYIEMVHQTNSTTMSPNSLLANMILNNAVWVPRLERPKK